MFDKTKSHNSDVLSYYYNYNTMLVSKVYSMEYLLFIDYDPPDRQRYIEQKCILSNYQAGSVPQVGLTIPGSRSIHLRD